ncbi:MAG TPA: hypothetical protein VEH04_17115 [Verrucomicrobiae bacterium]|nr:hypothetical protein [Verrucomicrobiae bacterium]
MARIEFNKPGTESLVKDVPTEAKVLTPNPQTQTANSEPSSQVPATITGTSTAVAAPPAPYDDDSIDAKDMVLPHFKIVQKVGELSNNFPHGSLLLNGSLVLREGKSKLGEKSEPVRILICGFEPTLFEEKVDYQPGLRGNLCKTEAEVVAKGGTLDYTEAQQTKKPWYQRRATALILVEQVSGLTDNEFPINIAGKNYALALYLMKGSAYTYGAKPIKTQRKIGVLRQNGYRGAFFEIRSELKKFGNNYAFVPVPRALESTTQTFRDELKAVLGF